MVDYCVETDIEAYLGTTFDGSSIPTSTQVGTIITDVSRVIDDYARRTVSGVTSGVVEYHDVTKGLDTIVLKKRPVSSITSIERIGSDGTVDLTLEAGRARDGTDDYYLSDADSGIVRFHDPWNVDVRDYLKITYSYGSVAIPNEARMAAILLTCTRVIQAKMLDENCTERVRQVMSETLKQIRPEAEKALMQVTNDRNIAVGILG